MSYSMQNNQQTVRQRYTKLKTQMNHHDPDLAQMAAQEVCKMILDDALDLKAPENRSMAKEITIQFEKQVGSENFQVHSNAIRCLAEIVPKLTKQLLVDVFKTIISSIADPKTSSKRKQVFTSSAERMIEKAPADIGDRIASLYVECVTQFINLSSRKITKEDEQVLIHLLTIIISFTSKWPDAVGNKQVKYNREHLIYVLIKYIETSTKIELVIKCMTALQKITTVFEKKDFEFVFNSKETGLLAFIIKNEMFTKNLESLRNLKNGILCLNHIVHAHNRQMKYWAKQIAQMCISFINSYKNLQIDTDTEREILVAVNEIIENSIDCLTSILKAYSSELTQWIGNGNYEFFSSFIEEALNFDMERMMNYLQDTSMENEDVYEEEDYDYTQDAVNWKVRQVCLAYVTMLMRRDKQFKNKKVKDPQFMNLLSLKLIEQNENVSKKAFECFNYIIESISTTNTTNEFSEDLVIRRVRSTERNFALDLVQTISNKIAILFAHKKTKQETKTEASKTLLNIIQLLNEQIRDNEAICAKILNLIQNLLPKVKPDSCINLMKSTKSLLNGIYPYEKIVSMIDVYIKMSQNQNFKIVAASFDGIRNVTKNYHLNLLKSGKINQILGTLIPKLEQHDADKFVKIQVIRCLGPIFAYILPNLPAKQQNEIILATETKLKVENDKTTILGQIPQIPLNFPVKIQQRPMFTHMLQMAGQTIGSANYQVNSLSIETCDRLLRILGNNISQKTVDSILNKSRGMLNEGKTPKFLDILIQNYPKAIKPYAEAIVRTGETEFNLKLVEKKIISAEDCVQILKTIITPQNTKKLSLFFSKINPSQKSLIAEVNDTKWGLVSLGALGYIGNLSTIEDINRMIAASKNDDFKFEGARAIGNIASRFPEYSLKLLQLLKLPHERQIYLHALKEMLNFRDKQFPQLEKVIYFLFEKSEENAETNKNILAECIGYVAKISPSQLDQILKSIPYMTPARKYVVASSFRYALEAQKSEKMQDERVQNFIHQVIQLTMDKDVNVREGAVKSLNSTIVQYFDKIRTEIDTSFMKSLLESISIKPEFIKIIDYGFGKENKDLAKGLRIQAFNFLKAILNIRQVENFYDAIISKCLEKINQETSNDIILKRINIIRLICEKDNTLFTPHQNEFATKIGVTEGVLKPYTTSDVQDERSIGYLKGLLKEILIIASLNKGGSQSIKGMMNKISTFERLNKIIIEEQKL